MIKWVTLPGLVDYQEAVKIMEEKVVRVMNYIDSDTIFLLEHKDVYTVGTSYSSQEILKHDLFPIIHTNRGGKCTYHGPGQRIIYPIINLNNKSKTKDLKLYVKNLEMWIILTLAELKIHAFRVQDKVGIWIRNTKNIDSKIGFIGIRVRKWVTYHGIAINLSTDLDNYSGIIPCGINDLSVTSLKNVGINLSMEDFDFILKKKFTEIF